MTYQASSNKFFKNDLKQRLWAIILMFVIFVIMEPMSLFMTIENFELYNEASYLPTAISDYLSYGYAADGRFGLLAGLVMAFICFYYLYSKSAVDFYHSLPVKREKVYLYKIIIGVGFGAAILIVCSALSFGVVAAKGYLTGKVAKVLMITSLKGLLSYLISFTGSTIAIMLTGTVVVGIIGGVILTFLPSFVTWLADSYMGLCFSTYYPYLDRITVGSVLLNPLKILDITVINKNFCLLFLVAFIEVIVWLFIGMILFVKRPSESVSKAISFKAAKPVIRIPLVILSALAGGLYVSYVASSLAEYWYWAAFIGTGILAHVILELIFEQELKGVIRHPIQFVSCLLVAGLIAVSMLYDWFGFDSYRPDEDMLQSTSVRIMNIESDINLYELNEFGDWNYGRNDDFYEKVNCDKDVALRLADFAISKQDKPGSAIKRHVEILMGNTEDTYTECQYVICYHLNSGRDVYRSYSADIEDIFEDIASVYENESYKKFIYEISPEIKSILKGSVRCSDAFLNEVVHPGMMDEDKFFDLYMADLMDRKLSDLRGFPIFMLNGFDPVSGMDFLSMYSIYETDTRSLDYLKELGVDVDEHVNLLTPESVKSIKIFDYDNQSEYGEPQTFEYTPDRDMDKITRLIPELIPSNVAYINGILHPVEGNVGMSVNHVTHDGMVKEDYFEVLKGTEVF